MRKYRIIDRQGMGTHADEVYTSKAEIREHLQDYHSVDWVEDYPIARLSLDDLLEYGEWDIEEISAQELEEIAERERSEMELQEKEEQQLSHAA